MPHSITTSHPYYAYLLRLWQAGTPENPAWRASLEDPHTRYVIGFNSLDELFTYLRGLGESEDGTEPSSGYSTNHPS